MKVVKDKTRMFPKKKVNIYAQGMIRYTAVLYNHDDDDDGFIQL